MKKVILFLIIGLLIVGCSKASSSEKKGLIKALEDKGYIEKGFKKVGESSVYARSFDASPIYERYDVYGKGDKYYTINFENKKNSSSEKCDFIIYVYDDVQFIKDKVVSQYNNDKQEYEDVIKDVYETNRYSFEKYCGIKLSDKEEYSVEIY